MKNPLRSLTPKILNIAENQPAAQTIATILSKSSARTVLTRSKHNPIYEFIYSLRGQKTIMNVCSIGKSLMNLDFDEQYYSKDWNSISGESIIRTENTQQTVDPEKQDLINSLKNLARDAKAIILWLDCTQEGEHLAFQVVEVCQQVNPNIEIQRAHFAAFTELHITNSLEMLRSLDLCLVDAFECRQEISLRIAHAFSRYQTNLIRKALPDSDSNQIFSFSIAQFLTLGYIVERWKVYKELGPESYWVTVCKYNKNLSENTNDTVEFEWDRGHIYDRDSALILFEKCFENPRAQVISVNKVIIKKEKPVPLSTIEFQKLGLSQLKLSCNRLMDAAEKLYNKGFISYPYTEANSFPPTMNLKSLVELHRSHPIWGHYAEKLLDSNGFQMPKGDKRDGLPIHPVKMAVRNEDGLTLDEWVVYDLITRSFLASCSKDAVGTETIVKIQINREKFTAKGISVSEYSWFEIYPYETLLTIKIPEFQPDEQFIASNLELKEVNTPPSTLLFTEDELIHLLCQNGVGTNGKSYEYIETLTGNNYIEKQGEKEYLQPTKLGIALVEAYGVIKTDIFKPLLLASIEEGLMEVSKGELVKKEFLDRYIKIMSDIFSQVESHENDMLKIIKRHFMDDLCINVEDSSMSMSQFQPFNDEEGVCGRCSWRTLRILKNKDGLKIVRCSFDSIILQIPQGDIHFKENACPSCFFQMINVKQDHNEDYDLCAWCLANPPQTPNNNEIVVISSDEEIINIKESQSQEVLIEEAKETSESAFPWQKYNKIDLPQSQNCNNWASRLERGMALENKEKTRLADNCIVIEDSPEQYHSQGYQQDIHSFSFINNDSTFLINKDEIKDSYSVPDSEEGSVNQDDIELANIRLFLERYEKRKQRKALGLTGTVSKEAEPYTKVRRPISLVAPEQIRSHKKNKKSISKEKCLRCKEPGHSMNSCPNIKKIPNNKPEFVQDKKEPEKGTNPGYNAHPNVTCVKCKQKGHYANNCPKPGKTKDQSKDNDSSKQGECFICHQKGHWATICPSKGQDNKAKDDNGSGGNNFKQNNKPGNSKFLINITCYKCNRIGHYANVCPELANKNLQANDSNLNNNNDRALQSEFGHPRTPRKRTGACPLCGQVDEHQLGSTCPLMNRKQVKRNES